MDFLSPNKRMLRALLALSGTSIGDSFGEIFFPHENRKKILDKIFPEKPELLEYTDDTEMAIGILEVLQRYGTLIGKESELLCVFAKNFKSNFKNGKSRISFFNIN